MTEEDALQAAIDADPRDKLPRLVFADWLDERADPRAEGYRVLATFDRWPWIGVNRFFWSNYTATERDQSMTPAFWRANFSMDRSALPEAWRAKAGGHQEYNTRRAAMDAVALAWANLSDDEKTACLAHLHRG